jgi:EAL and modified HD-GYP domain-containing signal transduction protein
VETVAPEIAETLANAPVETGGDVVLLARQPIVDATLNVQGHELLFRRADGTGWPIADENQATAHVLVAAFADLSLGAVTGDAKAWINVPASFLLTTDLSVLPSARVVLELLERDDLTAAFYARVVELSRGGFELALDDFTWRDDLRPLVELATYVKLDIRELGVAGVAEHVRILSDFDVTIVAEKVETADERDACLALGIELYQGYFFEKPRLVRGKPAPHAALQGLRNATSLSSTATFEEVEQVVRLDPGLSVRLLRYINSAAVSLRSRVSSLRHALMLVGANTVRQWLLLVFMGDIGSARPAVLTAALVRAKLCETLAKETGARAVESAFIVGLLSVCDALLDTSLEDIIPTLPLTEEVRDAIVRKEGQLGQVLATAIALQHGEGTPDVKHAYALYDAVRWADQQVAEFTGMAA